MPVATQGETHVQSMIDILERMRQHRKARPTVTSDELYYEYISRYYQRILQAKEEGKYIVGHTVMAPIEIFFAMDVVPMHLESTASTMAILLNRYAEFLNTARAFGLTPECCSAHRILAASFVQQVLPCPDVVLWTSQSCDNTAKAGDALTELYQVPGFFLDRPYQFTDSHVNYYKKQLAELVSFLEERTGKKMDYDRLKEVVKSSLRVMELYRELYELRKAVPAPMRNRSFMNQLLIEWTYCGTPEGVKFFETVRDEVKGNVEQGRGAVAEERHRILSLFLPPFYENKLLDWMEREYGAAIVMDPMSSWPMKVEVDPDDPMEAVARITFYRVGSRLMHGPADVFIEDCLLNAREFKADGALYFAHIGCRQACALIKPIKDALRQELALRTAVIDMDLMDPSFSSSDELRGKLEEFFEMLDE